MYFVPKASKQTIIVKDTKMVKNQLKIAIVLNTTWNIYNFRLGLIKQLIKEGHQVFAVAPKDDYVEEVEATGCKHIALKHLSRKGVNPLKDLRLCFELYQLYSKQQFDYILHYTIKPNIYGTIAAGFSGRKSMATVTGLGYSFMKEGFVHKIVKKLYAFAFRYSDKVAFQNRDDLALFTQLNLSTVSKSILIKGSGVNTSFFSPMPKNRNEQGPVFLFVGRLLYDKGVRELFEAAKILKQSVAIAQVWVVGAIDKGNPSAITDKLVQEYVQKDIINYMGQSDDVRSIMSNADVVVLPSYREGLPRVMLESLSMAKPVITTDAPGCKETVIHQHNGWMVAVADAADLAKAMIAMAKMPKTLLEQMGAAGREMALNEFDEHVIIDQYLRIIADI